MGSFNNSDLCIKCGACCDGTAFGHVQLQDNDLADVSLEMNLLKAEGRQILKQPCTAHINNCCSIYADRPSACRSYECKLLKEFKQGQVTEPEAFEAIEQLKTLKNEIEASLKVVGIDNEEDDVHLKMWTLEKEVLVTSTTEEFHDLHRPLLERYQVFKKTLLDEFGVDSMVVSSFPLVVKNENQIDN